MRIGNASQWHLGGPWTVEYFCQSLLKHDRRGFCWRFGGNSPASLANVAPCEVFRYNWLSILPVMLLIRLLYACGLLCSSRRAVPRS